MADGVEPEEENPFSFKNFVQTKHTDEETTKAESKIKDKSFSGKKGHSSRGRNNVFVAEVPFPDVDDSDKMVENGETSLAVVSSKPDGTKDHSMSNPFSFKNFVSRDKDVASKKKRVLQIIGDEVHEIKPTPTQGTHNDDNSQYLFGFTPPGSGSESSDDEAEADRHDSAHNHSPKSGSVNYFVAPAESSHSQLVLIEELNQLREDNERLKKEVEEITTSRDYEKKKVTVLQNKLKMIEKREADETAALENMVQMVEKNLELTTQRALRAETTVTKLKEEIKQVKADTVPMATYQQLLNTHHSTLNAVKEKSLSAADEMATTARRAEQALRDLYSGVETLKFVSSQLNYIDRITEVPKHPEDT
ncbi:endosome-associated-trafficking regulator 1 isoform X1 [Nematostella vectensis]|uniref:endosome-associated-trafficking regulator 1 isoform X1 n=1 Tax=Nematostella vectensis TaxID=45351 RepID=UPI00138FF214|nr:endosome-associated-trafficking regulator 1 isoform X1 [Nematostella vectensis]